jgi:hypothetical protein
MISQTVASKLRSKAATARTIAQRKAEKDKDCEMYELAMLKSYDIYSLLDYLKGYLSKGYLDQPPQSFGKHMKTTLRHVSKAHYIYLKDRSEEGDIDEGWLQRQNDYISSLVCQQVLSRGR